MQRNETGGNPISTIAGLVILVLVFVALFMLARFVFRILTFLSPVLIIAALILDYKVVVGYGKWLLDLVRRNPVSGVVAILLTIFGFPLVAAFLAGKALFTRNLKKARKEQQKGLRGEYIDFEEVEEEPPLQLPELSRQRPKMKEEPLPPKEEPSTKKKTREEDDPYDHLFE